MFTSKWLRPLPKFSRLLVLDPSQSSLFSSFLFKALHDGFGLSNNIASCHKSTVGFVLGGFGVNDSLAGGRDGGMFAIVQDAVSMECIMVWVGGAIRGRGSFRCPTTWHFGMLWWRVRG
jgi:hypothetical protein